MIQYKFRLKKTNRARINSGNLSLPRSASCPRSSVWSFVRSVAIHQPPTFRKPWNSIVSMKTRETMRLFSGLISLHASRSKDDSPLTFHRSHIFVKKIYMRIEPVRRLLGRRSQSLIATDDWRIVDICYYHALLQSVLEQYVSGTGRIGCIILYDFRGLFGIKRSIRKNFVSVVGTFMKSNQIHSPDTQLENTIKKN